MIIQSNNDLDFLRYKVNKLGYKIINEALISDAGIIYTVIKFKKGFRKYNLNDYMFGPILKNNIQYRKYLINKYKHTLKQISITKVSAKLNIGKSYPNILKSKKSITYPYNTLSIKLPIAPPIIKL